MTNGFSINCMEVSLLRFSETHLLNSLSVSCLGNLSDIPVSLDLTNLFSENNTINMICHNVEYAIFLAGVWQQTIGIVLIGKING